MFDCYDLAANKITTASYLDCNPSLPLTMTANEFAKLANVNSAALTVADLFAVPSVADLQLIFTYGFRTTLIVYLTAWAFGVVVNFINEE